MELSPDQERYRKGAHTVLDLKYHFVWKTKHGNRVLVGDIGMGLRTVLKEIAVEKGLSIVKGHIRPEHVHILVSAPSHMSPSKIAQLLKGKSSYRLQREFPELTVLGYAPVELWIFLFNCGCGKRRVD